MTEKKAIVIKVKYPVAGHQTGIKSPAPQVITEWNLKRISAAVLAVLVVVGAVIYGVNHEESHAPLPIDSNSALDVFSPPAPSQLPAQSAVIPEAIKTQNISKLNPESNIEKSKVTKTINISKTKSTEHLQNKQKKANKNVVRALITHQINNKEPGLEISQQVSINKKPSWVYYFTELKEMNGEKVYHEWLKNNVRISKYELIIAADTWRTSSRKLLSDTDRGKWTVRLLDKYRHILNEKKFKVD